MDLYLDGFDFIVVVIAAQSCDTRIVKFSLNGRTAIVVYQLFLQMVLGQKFGVGDIISFLCRVALGA